MEATESYNVGDCLMILESTHKSIYWEIVELMTRENGSIVTLKSVTDQDSYKIFEYYLYLHAKYVKVNKSTVEILFGGSNGRKG